MKTVYRCTDCGAEDSDRTSMPPAALICTNRQCRAGFDPKAMQAQHGMFPVNEAGYYPWGEQAPIGAI